MQAARRRSTIIEVAARANVAFSTVSRVLNGGYASPEVRARVEQAARELNYTPSPIARNLKTGRQGCIGVVVESSQCSWFTQVLGGIEEALADKTVSALLGSLNLRGSYDSSTIERWIADRRVDGLIFARCTRREEGLVTQAREAQLPMVFIAPDENFAAGPVFVARNREAARTLTEHLIALGHRRFAFLGGAREDGRRHRAAGRAARRAGGARAGARGRERAVRRDFPAERRGRGTPSNGWRSRARRRRPR